jgi:eukaryotic-like serine/threonine-protein kinase
MSRAKSETRIWLTAGTLVRNYKIDARIAASGIGEIYRAINRSSKQVVALKILPAPPRCNVEQLEALALQMNRQVIPSHPAICEIYEVGVTEDGKLFVASEYVHGHSLDTFLAAKADFDVENFAEQMAVALQVAHESGLVHADLKMSNVMLTADGKVKVLDFGLTKYKQLCQRNAEDQKPSGVRHFSPEHVNDRTLTAQTDLFSLGAMLYEMVTGVAPFTGETPLKVCAAIVWNKPQPIAELTDRASAEFGQSIAKLLEKDPNERTASAEALLAELMEQRVSLTPPPKHFGAAMFQAGQRFMGSEDGQMVAGFGKGAFQFVFNDGAGWVVLAVSAVVACYALVSFMSLIGLKQ